MVLVLFGASGTGKSTMARQIAADQGITWMQVDDLRLALQYSRATLPELTDELYFFETTPRFWTCSPATLRDAFVGVAEAMAPAVRVVIDSHVVTGVPMVIEGDGIHPDLLEDPAIAPHIESGAVRFCCVASQTHRELIENMVDRGRGDHLTDRIRVSQHAAANYAFNEWLVRKSIELGIPVVRSRPFDSLEDRILAAINQVPD
jgi:2-phosphoglycerate kinase